MIPARDGLTLGTRYRLRQRLVRLAAYAVTLSVGVLFVLPFAWLVSTSFKHEHQMYTWPPQWIPDPFWPYNYVEMFTLMPLTCYLWNSLSVTLLGTLGTVLSASLVGYGFARLRAPGLRALFWLVLATLMLPPQTTIIPKFLLFAQLGWIDTHLPLWVPAWFGGGPWYIFLFRQFFTTLPRDLEEAALLDGAGQFGIFWRIAVPYARPAFAVAIMFAAQGLWTDIAEPVIYLHSREQWTLALGITTLIGTRVSHTGALMAAAVLMTIPIVALFLLVQGLLTEGIIHLDATR